MPLSVPILRGPLRGHAWFPQSGGKLLRVLGGTYEREQTARFLELIRPGDVLCDIGAHVGYYTLLASRLVGPNGKVLAFEPSPRNHAFLLRHIERNRCDNVEPVKLGVAARVGTTGFAAGTGSGTGRLAEGGAVEVETTTLDAFFAERAERPDFLKVDTEGGEIDVLDGGAQTLAGSRPVIFLSTHGDALHAECLARLRKLDYRFEAIVGDDALHTPEVLCLPS